MTQFTLSLRGLWERDGGRCHICGGSVDIADASRDHVVPVAHGGSNAQENIRLAHLRCNASKAASMLAVPRDFAAAHLSRTQRADARQRCVCTDHKAQHVRGSGPCERPVCFCPEYLPEHPKEPE